MVARWLGAWTSVMVIIVLIVAVLVGEAWRGKGQDTSYVFSPCPGLAVISTATTGVWNCPNQLALVGGQNVTLTGTCNRIRNLGLCAGERGVALHGATNCHPHILPPLECRRQFARRPMETGRNGSIH